MFINLILSLHLLFIPIQEERFGKLVLTIENIEEAKGNIALLLFQGKEGFPDNETNAVREMVVKIKVKRPVIIIDSLPYGNYAVSLMQDLNDNNQMDENFFGLPEEPFGMSNVETVGFFKPTFEDAKFDLNQVKLEMNIKLLTVF